MNTQNPPRSKWKCPACSSERVQISLPTWYRETIDGDPEIVEADTEADVLWWYCEDCEDTGNGAPERTEP